MDTILQEVNLRSINVIQECYYFMGDIYTACSENKWWRVVALFAVMMTMVFVKPLLVVFLAKWICVTWGVSLFVGKGLATCVVGIITTQVRKLLKSLTAKINC